MKVVPISWRRQWHPTPVLLPGKSHGRRCLVGCSPWGREESDTTEATQQQQQQQSSSYFLAILPGTHEIMINLFYFIDPPFLINKIVTRLDKGLNKIFGKRLAHSGNAINKSTLF